MKTAKVFLLNVLPYMVYCEKYIHDITIYHGSFVLLTSKSTIPISFLCTFTKLQLDFIIASYISNSVLLQSIITLFPDSSPVMHAGW